ncbi:MAG: ABC transporter substrate-binding protein [Actinomycetes bacterium]|jgi:NitT/TauT family transport system substrate-binding protein|nr:ABC transporter substrate-binding protein [Actinomycetes bacterium]
MKKALRSSVGLGLCLMLALVMALALGGCSAGRDDAQSARTEGSGADGAASLPAIKVGTLQTDDLLPLWVAEAEGLLTQGGLNVEIQSFQSAQEQIAAVTAGEIDAIMTDLVVPVQLTAAGTPMRAVTIMQGAPAGVVAGKDSGISTVSDLAGVKTGCSSPTILEFIYDKALTEAGVPADQIQTEEIKKLPVRLEMLQQGQIKAAALPWTLWQLAVQQGAVPVLDEAQDGSYTSTVLEFRDEWLQQENAAGAIKTLRDIWDQAVDLINASPDSYRELLVEKAKLPEPLRDSYPVRHYPATAPVPQEQVEEVVNWMVDKGYLNEALAYAELIYE